MTVQSALLVVSVLAAVLMLILAGTRLLQIGLWRSQAKPGRTLVLRESIALDSRRRVHLVQCGTREVILLTGGTQDVVVGWTQDP
jgi:flagellar protein FliO/FliZ